MSRTNGRTAVFFARLAAFIGVVAISVLLIGHEYPASAQEAKKTARVLLHLAANTSWKTWPCAGNAIRRDSPMAILIAAAGWQALLYRTSLRNQLRTGQRSLHELRVRPRPPLKEWSSC